MSSRIEDYALIGDCESAALVSKGTAPSTGSVSPASTRGRSKLIEHGFDRAIAMEISVTTYGAMTAGCSL
jgi:hypothetical protein